MWLFHLLLGMAGCGMVTTVMTPIFMFTSLASWLADHSAAIVLVLLGIAGLVYAAHRAFQWYFYDRHAHLRVGIHQAKRREAREA